MRRVLFVDDETGILDGLRRMLRPMRNEWEMVFVTSGPEALAEAERQPFDIVVSDMRMPGMDGAELLEQFHLRFPGTLRFVLSGYSEKEMVVRASPMAHRFLTKPCDPVDLKDAISRSLHLAELVGDQAVRELIHGLGPLPPAPDAYRAVAAAITGTEPDPGAVISIIESDVAMSAKLLQLVNSTLFDQPGAVGSIGEAVPLLGLNLVKDLVLVTEVFLAPPLRPDLAQLQLRIQAEATSAAAIARRAQGRELGDEAFVAGLLHDIGLLVLAARAPDRLRRILEVCRAEQRPLADVERDLHGTTHAELGGYLLGVWGLPDVIVDAVAYHHRPADAGPAASSVVTAVHLASVLVEVGAEGPDRPAHRLDLDHLSSLPATGNLREWRLLVGDSAGQGWPVEVGS